MAISIAEIQSYDSGDDKPPIIMPRTKIPEISDPRPVEPTRPSRPGRPGRPERPTVNGEPTRPTRPERPTVIVEPTRPTRPERPTVNVPERPGPVEGGEGPKEPRPVFF